MLGRKYPGPAAVMLMITSGVWTFGVLPVLYDTNAEYIPSLPVTSAGKIPKFLRGVLSKIVKDH